MSECKHDRIQVVNVYSGFDSPGSKFVFWREQCTHCDKYILQRAPKQEVPDRVQSFMRNQTAPLA